LVAAAAARSGPGAHAAQRALGFRPELCVGRAECCRGQAHRRICRRHVEAQPSMDRQRARRLRAVARPWSARARVGRHAVADVLAKRIRFHPRIVRAHPRHLANQPGSLHDAACLRDGSPQTRAILMNILLLSLLGAATLSAPDSSPSKSAAAAPLKIVTSLTTYASIAREV